MQAKDLALVLTAIEKEAKTWATGMEKRIEACTDLSEINNLDMERKAVTSILEKVILGVLAIGGTNEQQP